MHREDAPASETWVKIIITAVAELVFSWEEEITRPLVGPFP